MYYPFLRGKQFELIALRELSNIISHSLFRPIIEPVRTNTAPLLRTIEHLNQKEIIPVILINPTIGDYKDDWLLLKEKIEDSNLSFLPCVQIRSGNADEVAKILQDISGPYALQITQGIDQNSISLSSGAELTIADYKSPPAALARIKNLVLLGEDSFRKQKRNADYTSESTFSYLHSTYKTQENVIGFGDYTIMSNEYTESGGPAYVVTIHASYIDYERFDEMFVRHYSSTDDGTPSNPAGKFAEALTLFMNEADTLPSIFYDSHGIKEFRKLHESEHFPGLGQVKKLSMEHHIETICNYLDRNQ
tara:strand:+ start:1326 stop:2243 length:918 start_codon:yes stop_codon:yes gene_type:complete